MASVSVIIPAFNSENHIRRSIDSVLNQTMLPLEVIVVNDGSTDETGTIANSYGGIVRVVSKGRNCGLPAARNFGVDNAQGDWIAFLDSDDEWLPMKNEVSCNTAETLGVDWCMVAQANVSSSDEKVESASSKYEAISDRYFSLAKQGKGGCPSSIMVKKSVIGNVGGFNEALTTGEDLEMWWRIANLIPIIGYCEKQLVKYYVDVPGSMTRSPRNELKLIAYWKSVTEISGSTDDAVNADLFIQVRDTFAAKAIRFYVRAGYNRAADYMKNNTNIHYHTVMRLVLMLPYPLTKVIFITLYNVKNKYLLSCIRK